MSAEEVKLHGFWASYFTVKVKWALNLKGIKYEYVEEDLINKSDVLVELNPVYKKVPVLLRAGKEPVLESAVIIEYIQDTWPHGHALLPEDAADRAVARFWIAYGIEKASIFYSIIGGREGEQLDEAVKQAFEVLKVVEEQSLGDNKFFGGETISAVDITFGWFAVWLECGEEVVGVKVLDPIKLPRLHAWRQNFKQVPAIKEAFPDYQKLIGFFTDIRANILSSYV